MDPEYAEAWSNKGWTLAKLHRYDEALKCITKALELNPNLTEAQKLKQVVIQKQGSNKAEDTTIWHNKGIDLSDLGRYQEAIACFDKAIEINPRCTESWIGKGSILYKLGKYKEALICYDEAIKIEPENCNVLFNKGMALGKLHRYIDKFRCLLRVVKIDPDYIKRRLRERS